MQQRLTVDAISPFPHIFLYIAVWILTKKYLTIIQNHAAKRSTVKGDSCGQICFLLPSTFCKIAHMTFDLLRKAKCKANNFFYYIAQWNVSETNPLHGEQM